MVLNVPTCSPSSKQKKLKQVMGKTLTQIPIIGLASKQWELDISGIIKGTTKANVDTNRANMEALDDSDFHAYVDGLHNGTYILEPGSLKFQDKGENQMSNRYSLRLIEE